MSAAEPPSQPAVAPPERSGGDVPVTGVSGAPGKGVETVAAPADPAGMPTADRYPQEWRRLGSLWMREGVAATNDFCRRTVQIYRRAVLDAHRHGHAHASFASLPEYRSRFIRSYCEFKRFQRYHAGAGPGSA
jgi:hypothetical protein